MDDWRQMCRGVPGISVEGDAVVVAFADGRHHRVEVRETDETYELRGIVARKAELEGVPDVAIRAWRRNRTAQLVGFRIDQRGRLVGEGWTPKAGLAAQELLLLLRRVAAECDRFEYILTGKDRE